MENGGTKKARETLHYSPIIHPFSEFTSVSDIDNFDWADGSKNNNFQGLKEKARKLRNSTDYCLVSPPLSNTFEYTTFLFGLKKAMKLVRTNPDMIIRTMEQLLKYWMDYAEHYLKEVGNNIDVICVNGDLADQMGPLINPIIYVKHVKPLDQKFVNKIRTISPNIHINYHSCGSIVEFLPHFADVGYAAINPIQLSAFDMEPRSLKSRFGNHVCFWGGMCDSQSVLPFKSVKDVKKETKKNIETLKAGGGFVAASIHNITAEVPPENIDQMFRSALEYA